MNENWYENIFDDLYIQIFEPLRTPEFTLFSHDKQAKTRRASVRIYTLTELVKMHKRAGLEYIKHSTLDGGH